MAFWNNPSEFLPKQAHRWVISFGERDFSDLSTISDSPISHMFAKSVSRPGYSLKNVPLKYAYSHQVNFPTRVIWNPIDLTFNDIVISNVITGNGQYRSNYTYRVGAAETETRTIKQSTQSFIQNLLITSGYTDINESVFNTEETNAAFKTYTFKQNLIKAFVGDAYNFITITELDGKGKVIEEWRLFNPVIAEVKSDKLDYSEEKILTINCTINYDYAKLLPARFAGLAKTTFIKESTETTAGDVKAAPKPVNPAIAVPTGGEIAAGAGAVKDAEAAPAPQTTDPIAPETSAAKTQLQEVMARIDSADIDASEKELLKGEIQKELSEGVAEDTVATTARQLLDAELQAMQYVADAKADGAVAVGTSDSTAKEIVPKDSGEPNPELPKADTTDVSVAPKPPDVAPDDEGEEQLKPRTPEEETAARLALSEAFGRLEEQNAQIKQAATDVPRVEEELQRQQQKLKELEDKYGSSTSYYDREILEDQRAIVKNVESDLEGLKKTASGDISTTSTVEPVVAEPPPEPAPEPSQVVAEPAPEPAPEPHPEPAPVVAEPPPEPKSAPPVVLKPAVEAASEAVDDTSVAARAAQVRASIDTARTEYRESREALTTLVRTKVLSDPSISMGLSEDPEVKALAEAAQRKLAVLKEATGNEQLPVLEVDTLINGAEHDLQHYYKENNVDLITLSQITRVGSNETATAQRMTELLAEHRVSKDSYDKMDPDTKVVNMFSGPYAPDAVKGKNYITAKEASEGYDVLIGRTEGVIARSTAISRELSAITSPQFLTPGEVSNLPDEVRQQYFRLSEQVTRYQNFSTILTLPRQQLFQTYQGFTTIVGGVRGVTPVDFSSYLQYLESQEAERRRRYEEARR